MVKSEELHHDETNEVVVRPVKRRRNRRRNEKRKKNICRHDQFKQKNQNEELATGI